MKYGYVCVPDVFLYGEDLSSRIDEVLYGWALEIQGDKDEYYYVETHYGYKGYISKDAVVLTDLQSIQSRESGGMTKTMIRRFVDVLSIPKVQGKILIPLGRGCLIEVTGEEVDGYVPVKTLMGENGYISKTALMDRQDSDGYFSSEDRENYFLKQKISGDEATLRAKLVEMCKLYDGSQYRWSGKSAHGTDCSGLVSMCYMLSGLLIFRDAKMPERWPMKQIEREQMKPGDAIYFPGHIAMYIGDGQYIHSTGYAENFGYAVNSLNHGDINYREDLANKIVAIGSVFAK